MKRQGNEQYDYSSIGNHPKKKRHQQSSDSYLDDQENYDYQNYPQNPYEKQDDDCHSWDGNSKAQFILSQSLAKKMVLNREAFVHSIDGKQFYFPYKKLNKPQENYIKAMFDCLDKQKNLLIQSPTGTGKTLSLLVGALSWAQRHYMNTPGAMFQNRLKIIYTSRAHSQLSQISKQLEKTPYRPKMLLFGSREKLCINEQLISQVQGQGDKKYNDWTQRCNISVELRKKELQSPQIIRKEINQAQKTIRQFRSKISLSQEQKAQLKREQENLMMMNSRCKHFHEYNKGLDKKFNREVGRTVLNNEILKNMAKQRKPATLCPYFYPKRVKMMGTLYLMPYNYLLDSVILEYSTNFLKNAIIIFDQGHNVPATACNGYSIKFSVHTLDAAKRNVMGRLSDNDIDVEEMELQSLMKQGKEEEKEKEKIGNKGEVEGEKKEKQSQEKVERRRQQSQMEEKSIEKQQKDQKIQKKPKQNEEKRYEQKYPQKSTKPMTGLVKWMMQTQNQAKNQQKQKKGFLQSTKQSLQDSIQQPKQKQQKPSLKTHTQFLVNAITNTTKNYEQFFKYQRQDFSKPSASFNSSGSDNYNNKNPNWWVCKQLCAYQRQQIQDIIRRIFFSSAVDKLKNMKTKERLQSLMESLKFVCDCYIKSDKYAFKLVNLIRFYQRVYNILYNKDYEHKFFIQVSQSKKFIPKKGEYQYKGDIQVRCLSPEFSFGQLMKINPYNIIITSGTLSPLNVFADQIGLKFVQTQVGHVISDENILVRKIAKNLQGEPLKIDSAFFYGQNAIFNVENLTALFNLLIKTIQCIPHGVLIIVSSFSSLKVIEKFYQHQMSRQIRKRLEAVKPHVYFETKTKLQVTMQRYNKNSQQGKGAVLFCVCRAKLSQGIDFKDRLCRSVIFLGIPYVSKGDPFITHKGAYLKKMKSPHASIWKFVQASKAINQGLGRTVRHARDFGSILLFDDRYQNVNRDSAPVVENISGWIKKDWRVNNDIGSLQNQLRQFYTRCNQRFPGENPDDMNEGQLSLDGYFKNKY